MIQEYLEKVTGDYWKGIIIEMQKENSRSEGFLTNQEDSVQEISKITSKFRNFESKLERGSSYISWILNLNETFQFRFYIQAQTKVSFMEKKRGNYEKLADTKLIHKPFAQIENFLLKTPVYLEELEKIQRNALNFKNQQKVGFEFLNAILMKKYRNTGIEFFAEMGESDYKIILMNKTEKHCYNINIEEIKTLYEKDLWGN